MTGNKERGDAHHLARVALAAWSAFCQRNKYQSDGDHVQASLYAYQARERARRAACLHQGLKAGLERDR